MTLRTAIILLLCLTATSARSQETRALEVTVTAIAGSDVYIDRGGDHGLAPGDTLEVARGGQALGQLVVRSVASGSAVVGFAGPPFRLTRGERLTISWTVGAEPAQPPAAEAEPPDRPSIFDLPALQTTSPPSVEVMHLSGRVQLGSSGFLGGVPVGGDLRTSATPFAAVRARATGLPLGLRADVNGHASIRYRSGEPFERPTDVRVYRAIVGGDVGPLTVEAGRLVDRYDRFTGPTDGLRLHLGDSERGFGFSAGFAPELGAGAVSLDLPRITAMGHSRFELGEVTGEVVLVAGQIRPRLEGLVPRSFAGTQARFGNGTWHLSMDALLDRDPGTGRPAFSRLVARGRIAITPEVRLTVHAARRQSYVLVGPIQTMRAPSDRLGAGIDLQARVVSLYADATYSAAGGRAGVVTLTSGTTVQRLPVAGLSLHADGSVWLRDGFRGAFATGGLSYAMGGLWLSAAYRFSSTSQPVRTLMTHGLDLTANLPLTRGVGWTVQTGADFSEQIITGRAYTGLWIQF